jgi:hypothetical protein
MAKRKGTWDISIEINGAKVKNNLKDIGKSIGKLNGQLKNLQPGTDAFIKKSAELKKAKKYYKDINDEIRGTNVSLEEAQGHFSNLFGGLVSGNFNMVQQGLKGIAGNIKGMTKAALGFIATPLGAAIAILTTVALAAKEWVSFNLEVEKANNQVKELTNTTGDAVDAIRIRAEVLKDTFGVELAESINSAKSLVQGFGISYDEAFDLIEKGAVTGKLKNNEFLESIKEYPRLFKNGGFSASEFVKIVNAGIDLSIYKDKLPDAIKEFVLSVTEQTPAAKSALINAFGSEFTGKLFRDLKTGATVPKEALKSIAVEATKIGLNSQQAQELTSNLFKGAGEDAGGALKIFEAVNTALTNQEKPLSEIQQLQADQLNSNKELSGIYTQLFATADGGFGKMIAKGKLFLTNVIVKLLKSGVDVYNWFVDLNNQSTVFSGSFAIAKAAISNVFSFFGVAVKTAIKSVGSLGTIIEGVFTLSPEKIKEGFTSGIKNITDGLNQLKIKAVKDAAEVKKAFSGGAKMEKFALGDLLADDTTTTETTTTKGGEGSVKSKLTPEDQKILDSKKHLKEKLDEWEAETKLQKEIKDLEEDLQKQAKEEFDVLNRFQKLEAAAFGEKDLLTRLETKKQTELQAIKDKWAKVALSKKDAVEKQRKAADKKAIEAENLVLQQRVNQYSQMFGGIATLLGKNTAAGKAAAIAQATFNTYQGVSEVWSTKSLLPEPFATISRIANTGIVLGSGLAAVSSIKSTSAPSFYSGGDTGTSTFGSDEHGGFAGFTHKNEYVVPEIIRTDPSYAPVIDKLENARAEKLGIESTAASAPDESTEVNKMLTDALYQLTSKLSEPIYAQALIGDDEISKQELRASKISLTRENARIKS